MKVLSATEMQACDRATTERHGIPSIELMRAASRTVAEFARAEFPQARRITVLCGRGNNGGDGMMAARLLAEAGLDIHTVLLGPPERFATDAGVAWSELLASARPDAVHVAETAEQLHALKTVFDVDLVVDAILGTGFKPPMRGLAVDALELVRASKASVLAVDLPSGWEADSTAAEGDAFPADAVITFTAPKPAHLFGQLTRSWRQPVVVAPIGSPDEAVVSMLGLHWAGDALALVQQPRAAAANKGRFGHVLVVGGSFGTAGGKAGAPAMASLAALMSGAGLVTVAVPAAAMSVVAAVRPELMTWPLSATEEGGIDATNLALERLRLLVAGKTVLAVGPGMGQAAETAKFLAGLLTSWKGPAVVDADALNLLTAKPVLLAKLAKDKPLVLTPHPGEMARLVGKTIAEVQANRLEMARALAAETGATVVLKGARTIVAHPDGTTAVNTTGNPAMAKGGSGDVLCGLIAGLAAQYPDELGRAVEAAVFLHGLSADLTVGRGEEHTLLATDSLRKLGRAFEYSPWGDFRRSGPSGYVCLVGHARRKTSGHAAHVARRAQQRISS
ncbi:MAG: NAD(P)H-hydrate dehydratase [Terracidiphilus sp.]|nr:NAD(P)H-hydrate dehydratase [Terracidiphilus sp.]